FHEHTIVVDQFKFVFHDHYIAVLKVTVGDTIAFEKTDHVFEIFTETLNCFAVEDLSIDEIVDRQPVQPFHFENRVPVVVDADAAVEEIEIDNILAAAK